MEGRDGGSTKVPSCRATAELRNGAGIGLSMSSAPGRLHRSAFHTLHDSCYHHSLPCIFVYLLFRFICSRGLISRSASV